MLHFVLPEFAAIYKTFNTPLPALTQGIMTLASFSGEWGWLLVLFGFLLAIANKLLMRHPTGGLSHGRNCCYASRLWVH